MANNLYREKMRGIALIVVLLEILFISGSCRSNKKKENAPDQTPVKAKMQIETAKEAPHLLSPGEEAFRKSCLTCHQADGSGVPGMYPPLNQAEKVMGPPEGVIKVILYGLKGPTVINGETYTQRMPAQGLLSDSTIAVLVNYVKKRWGGSESAVTAAEVRKIRTAGKH
jgi:mono/diheme cytochrome c family protein